MGDTGGAKTHTLTVAQMPSHAHTGVLGVDTGGQFGIGGGSSTGKGVATTGINNVYGSSIIVRSEGGGASHPIMNPYIIVNYEVICG